MEHIFFFEMASNSSHQTRTLKTDEVINAVFIDDDSGDEFLESSSESEVEETSSDEETNTSVTTDTNATNGRGQQKKRGPAKTTSKRKGEALEAKW